MNPFEPIKIERVESKIDYSDNAMSVGSVRYTFLQLRNCKNLDCNCILWNGMTAGDFATDYYLASIQKKSK